MRERSVDAASYVSVDQQVDETLIRHSVGSHPSVNR